VAQRLLELALQFCIYTEAANLRHTPHLLFLVYYVMRGGVKFSQVGRTAQQSTACGGRWAAATPHMSRNLAVVARRCGLFVVL
jgi:hypothetical protein